MDQRITRLAALGKTSVLEFNRWWALEKGHAYSVRIPRLRGGGVSYGDGRILDQGLMEPHQVPPSLRKVVAQG
jgi:hypothetical protein